MAVATKIILEADANVIEVKGRAEATVIEAKGKAEATVIEAKGKAENGAKQEALRLRGLELELREREQKLDAPPLPSVPTVPPPPPATTPVAALAVDPVATPVAVPPPVVGLAPCAKTVRDIAMTESGWDVLPVHIQETILSKAGRYAADKPHIVQMTEKVHEINSYGTGYDVIAYSSPFHAAVRTEVLRAWSEAVKKDAYIKNAIARQRSVRDCFRPV